MSQQRIWSERQHGCHKKTKSQSPVYIDKIYNSCKRACGEQSQTKWQKSKVRVSKTAWTNKTQEERQRYFRWFRNFVPKDKLTATSTDGKMTVIKPIIICIIFLVIIVVLVENLRLLCEDRSKPHQWEDF